MKFFNVFAGMLLAAMMVVAGCAEKQADVPAKDADAKSKDPGAGGGGGIPKGMTAPDEPPVGERGDEDPNAGDGDDAAGDADGDADGDAGGDAGGDADGDGS